jgi:SagB-type dehydrogenase family enzyme
VRDYSRRAAAGATALEIGILTALGRWRGLGELKDVFRDTGFGDLEAAIGRLRRRGWIESSDRPPSRAERALASWRDWAPSAALFHFDTKDVRYCDPRTADEAMGLRARIDPPPPFLKRTGGPTVRLPDYPRDGALPSVLLARRSWRRFGRGPLAVSELSTVIGLTWGIQNWLHVGRGLRLPLKTSPSGGACHSVEAYVAVRRVDGLSPGIYHYRPDDHALVALGRRWSAAQLGQRLGNQPWFSSAAAVVFMTAVFERVQWKYRFSRAYRVVLLEAGHLCQTFCLVATWLGLAPFCTAALADSLIERDLGLDGVSESVLYAAGLGRRPPGVAWAPWWDGRPQPRTSPPAFRERKGARSSRRTGP